MTDFYDSSRWGMMPAGADAMLYADGRYAASRQDAKRFRAVRWISVLGGAGVARNAGAADFEPGNAVYEVAGRLREFCEARKAMACRARVYCDLSNLKAAHALVGDMDNVVWWLALYGDRLDAEQLAHAGEPYGVILEPGRVWAQQFGGGPAAAYDSDSLIGAW